MQQKRPRWRLRRTNARFYTSSREAVRLRAGMSEFGVHRFRYLAAVPALILVILLVVWIKMPDFENVLYHPTEETFRNPMIGWASASSDPDAAPNSTLVYAEVTWRELEPEIDQFDFESFERVNNLEQWWARGAKMILRVVLDRPGEPGHMDIPDWLYEMTDGDGFFYEGEAGGGFSPNYANLAVRNRHGSLIWAIGERYNAHPGLAYVEIGSLGHEGLWRAAHQDEALLLPPPNVARSYIWHYDDGIHGALKLMVRPYREVRTLGLGVFNPALGDADATLAHLDAIHHGGYDEQIAADLYAVGDFWRHAPAGAHIAPAVDLDWLLTEDAGAFERQLRESHLSYVVVNQPIASLSEEALVEMERASFLMGYRFWVRTAAWNASVRQGYRASVRMELRNDGVAPLPGDWQAALSLQRGGEVALSQPVNLNIADIQPGRTSFYIWIDIPLGFETGEYELAFAILDPAIEQPSIRFAMEECGEDLWVRLGAIEVVR